MIWLKKNIPVVVIAAGLALFGVYVLYIKYHFRSFDSEYNTTRQSLGIPGIGKGWQQIQSADEIEFVNPDTATVRHVKKRVVPSLYGLPELEADLFFLPGKSGTLDMGFRKNADHSTAVLYRGEFGKPTVNLTYIQALDTLKKYHLLRY